MANYCVGGGYRSNAYIEKCAFTSNAAKKYPWKNYATSGTFNDYNYTITSCLGATDKQTRYGSIDYFIPSEKYSYESYDAALVQSVVSNSSNGAGATLKFTDPTAIQESASVADIVKVEYFSLDGSRLTMPRKGIAMQVVTKADGTKLTRKITLSK